MSDFAGGLINVNQPPVVSGVPARVYGSAVSVRKPRPYGGIPAEHIDPKANRGKRIYQGNNFANADLVDIQSLTYNMKAATDPNNRPMNTTKSWTYVRILPTRDDYNPDQWAPDVHPGQETGQWIRSFQMFKGGDLKTIKMILWDPADADYQRKGNPASMLYWNINRAFKAGTAPQGSERLLFSKKQLKEKGYQIPDSDTSFGEFSAPLAYSKPSFFARALILQRGDTPENPIQGLGADDKVPMLDLGSDAGAKLVTDFIKSGAKHQGYSFALDAGAVHCFYRKGDDPDEDDRFRKLEFGGYEVRSYNDKNFFDPNIAAFESVLFPKLVPFSEVFTIYDDEQQAELLAQAFQWDILDYAWRERPDYWKIAQGVHKRSTTVEVPGYPQGPGLVPMTMPAAAPAPAAPGVATPSVTAPTTTARISAPTLPPLPAGPAATGRVQWTPPTPPAPTAAPAPAAPAPPAPVPADGASVPSTDARTRAKEALARARAKVTTEKASGADASA
jgi:hypothetical protein